MHAEQSTPSPPRNQTRSPEQQRAHTPLVFDPVTSSPPHRSESTRSRSSIAKLPLPNDPSSPPGRRPAPLRSIFPTYDPELPLEQQPYGPTQLSPSHVPRAAISRQSYYDPDAMSVTDPEESRPPMPQLQPAVHVSPPSVAGTAFASTTVRNGPARANATLDPPVIPKTSTTEQLKTFWKAANGWKAAPSEGRVFCLRMTQLKDAPVYTLSSASQPFYHLRLDPTSASAYMSLSRHDPNKTYKAPKPEAASSSSSSIHSGSGGSSSVPTKTDSKHWHEALNTTLEEESRRHQPNDGLVALLMPTPATKMALQKANDPSAVMTAERECARLVWDDDSSNHFLVHPALAAPFCVTVQRCPAWSRVEYTLEHHESPRHLAKLTRDGTGAGWLEIDTGVASYIEAYYIIDVAVSALLLVAATDERNNGTFGSSNATAVMETFEPPPVPAATARSESRGSGRFSRLSMSGGNSTREEKSHKKKNSKKRRPMEEFEIDLESQDDSLRKGSIKSKSKQKNDEDKLPFLVRVVVKLAKGLFQCVIWVLTAIFKVFGGVFKVLYKCVGSKY